MPSLSNVLQLRKGTSSEHSSFTGAPGEITYDSDKDTVVVHDGATQGGFPLAKAGQLSSVTQVATIIARDALIASSGDMAIVIENSTNYIYDGTNWLELQTPVDTVTSVNTQTGSVVLNAGHVNALADTHDASAVTSTGISHWNSAWGWGNHASAGYASAEQLSSYYAPSSEDDLVANIVKCHPAPEVPGVDPPLNLELRPAAGGFDRGSVEVYPSTDHMNGADWYTDGGAISLKGAKDMYGSQYFSDITLSNDSGIFKVNGQAVPSYSSIYTQSQVDAKLNTKLDVDAPILKYLDPILRPFKELFDYSLPSGYSLISFSGRVPYNADGTRMSFEQLRDVLGGASIVSGLYGDATPEDGFPNFTLDDLTNSTALIAPGQSLYVNLTSPISLSIPAADIGVNYNHSDGQYHIVNPIKIPLGGSMSASDFVSQYNALTGDTVDTLWYWDGSAWDSWVAGGPSSLNTIYYNYGLYIKVTGTGTYSREGTDISLVDRIERLEQMMLLL